jgi:hypothetical protein
MQEVNELLEICYYLKNVFLKTHDEASLGADVDVRKHLSFLNHTIEQLEEKNRIINKLDEYNY